MRKSKYTRELLAPIVAEASSLTDVIRTLGLEPTGGNWRYIRARLRHRIQLLHLDHINGINNENRRENLRLLCPNCHSQTDTYGRHASRASEVDHVLYDGLSRAWRNWYPRRL